MSLNFQTLTKDLHYIDPILVYFSLFQPLLSTILKSWLPLNSIPQMSRYQDSKLRFLAVFFFRETPNAAKPNPMQSI